MTDRQRRSLSKYIRFVADHMGLRDWTINLEKEPCDEHAAEVACIYGRKIANVCVSSDWMIYPPEEQRHVVIHELMHVHLDGALTLVQTSLPDLIGKPAMLTFETAYRQQNEHAVDAIASMFEEFVPLWMP